MSKAHHKHPLEAWISFLLGMMLCVGPLLFGGVYPSGFLFLSSVSALCLVLCVSFFKKFLLSVAMATSLLASVGFSIVWALAISVF